MSSCPLCASAVVHCCDCGLIFTGIGLAASDQAAAHVCRALPPDPTLSLRTKKGKLKNNPVLSAGFEPPKTVDPPSNGFTYFALPQRPEYRAVSSRKRTAATAGRDRSQTASEAVSAGGSEPPAKRIKTAESESAGGGGDLSTSGGAGSKRGASARDDEAELPAIATSTADDSPDGDTEPSSPEAKRSKPDA